jgi:sn-glycerol 3-phosphate transport system permease protein
MTLVVMAAVWKQISYNFLFFLAGLQSIPEKRAGSQCDRRSRSAAPILDHRVSAALTHDILPAGRECRLCILRHVRHHRRGDRRRPAGATTTMVYKVYADGRLGGDLGGSAAQSVVLMVIVIALTAVQFRYVERKVQY